MALIAIVAGGLLFEFGGEMGQAYGPVLISVGFMVVVMKLIEEL